MKFRTLVLSTLVAFSGAQVWAQTNTLTSVGIVTGTVTLTDRVGTPTNQPGTVGNNLAGLAYVAGNVPGAVDTSVSFFTLTGATLPPNPANTFTSYGTLISPTAVGSYPDVAALATANSYSGLTFAIDDLGLPIAGTFYMIHHKNSGDYFANIVPRTGGLSSTSDLKPMSWQGGVAGGPSDPGAAGYFGLAYATGAVSGYSANSMFYLRTDGASHTQFGEMIPALTGASTDKIDLTTAVGSFGAGGYTTLAYSPVAFGGYAANQFYYLRLDSITGNTILGRLDPSLVPGTRTISDIANLGGSQPALRHRRPLRDRPVDQLRGHRGQACRRPVHGHALGQFRPRAHAHAGAQLNRLGVDHRPGRRRFHRQAALARRHHARGQAIRRRLRHQFAAAEF
jgi:hypothetical protein